MNDNFEKKEELKNKIFEIFKKSKALILSSFFISLILILVVFFFQISKSKKNELISEKYINAGILLSLNEKEKAKEIYEEIITDKNSFYAILSIKTILEKNLESNKQKILAYFKEVENLNISKKQKDLLILKKALFLINSNELKEGETLLENLVESNSKYKSIAKEILISLR